MAQNFRLENRDPAALVRRACIVALLYVPAGLAFLFLKPHGEGDDAVIFDLADTMLDRFESLVQHAFDDSAYVLPIALFAGLALALYLRKARLHPAMWGTLGAAAGRARSSRRNGPSAAGRCTCACPRCSAPCCLRPPNCA